MSSRCHRFFRAQQCNTRNVCWEPGDDHNETFALKIIIKIKLQPQDLAGKNQGGEKRKACVKIGNYRARTAMLTMNLLIPFSVITIFTISLGTAWLKITMLPIWSDSETMNSIPAQIRKGNSRILNTCAQRAETRAKVVLKPSAGKSAKPIF